MVRGRWRCVPGTRVWLCDVPHLLLLVWFMLTSTRNVLLLLVLGMWSMSRGDDLCFDSGVNVCVRARVHLQATTHTGRHLGHCGPY